MSVLHLRIRGPAVVDVEGFEYLQGLARHLIDLSRQTADARTLGEFKKTARAVGFRHEFDVNRLHGNPPFPSVPCHARPPNGLFGRYKDANRFRAASLP